MFPQKNKITMQQIAARAKVSVGTVSHVINNTAGVRESVRRRVQETIRELGYRPSLLARSLRTNRTTIIGMIIPDILNPFFPQVVRGVEDVAYQNSYQLMLCNTDNDAKKEYTYAEQLRAYRMAGVVVIPSAHSHLATFASELNPREGPLICLDRRIKNWKGDSVTVDNASGAYEAARLLFNAGHRRIATITGPLHLANGMERLRGFRRALRELGAPLRTGYVRESNFDRAGGYEQALSLLQKRDRPTAIFAANDLVALGILSAIKELGLSCPDDISIVGFDDLEMTAFTNPPLTTVSQPGYEMGALGASLLLERLTGKTTSPQNIVLKTKISMRGSVARPRK
jgi:LacI family transcriptional regulator